MFFRQHNPLVNKLVRRDKRLLEAGFRALLPPHALRADTGVCVGLLSGITLGDTVYNLRIVRHGPKYYCTSGT